VIAGGVPTGSDVAGGDGAAADRACVASRFWDVVGSAAGRQPVKGTTIDKIPTDKAWAKNGRFIDSTRVGEGKVTGSDYPI
jgi:hypothetical protein